MPYIPSRPKASDLMAWFQTAAVISPSSSEQHSLIGQRSWRRWVVEVRVLATVLNGFALCLKNEIRVYDKSTSMAHDSSAVNSVGWCHHEHVLHMAYRLPVSYIVRLFVFSFTFSPTELGTLDATLVLQSNMYDLLWYLVVYIQRVYTSLVLTNTALTYPM